MSYQTREQSLGYIIKSFLVCDYGIHTIARVMNIAKEQQQPELLTNADTSIMLGHIMEQLGLSDEARSSLRSALQWEGFDDSTVEEAGRMYRLYDSFLREAKLVYYAARDFPQ